MRIPLFNRRGSNRATDPVCDMQVDTNNPPGGEWEHAGQTYYFCGPRLQPRLPKRTRRLLVRRKKDEDVGEVGGVCRASAAFSLDEIVLLSAMPTGGRFCYDSVPILTFRTGNDAARNESRR